MKEHYDICVIGCWWGANYGSVLNGYAVYKTLKSFGLSVLMLHKHNAVENDWEIVNTHNAHFIEKFYPSDEVSPIIPFDELSRLNEICDIFLTGSDQVWNYGINKLFNISDILTDPAVQTPDYKQLSSYNALAETILTEIKALKDNAKKQNTSLQTELKSLHTANNKLTAELSKVNAANSALTAELSKSTASNFKLSTDLGKLTGERKQLTESLTAANKRTETLSKERDLLSQTVTRLESKTNRILTAPAEFRPTLLYKNGNEPAEEIILPADDTFKKSVDFFVSCIRDKNVRESSCADILRQAELMDKFERKLK